MDDALQAYTSADRPLSALLSTVAADRWSAPSPCPGWAARDVVAHLVTTQRDFLTTHGADLGPTPDVAADPARAWADHAAAVRAALASGDLAAEEFDGFFGPTTVGAALVQLYVWDVIAHRWDLARAVGGDESLDEDELDRLERGASGFGEALRMEGICGPAVEVSSDAPRQVRVLAHLGRRS